MTSRPRSRETVLTFVEGELRAGRLCVGDHLPGERTLADTLGISRSSVREGIRVLEAMGLLRTAVGSGPSSGTVLVAQPSIGLGAALRLHAASSHLPIADLVQMRVLLETWAVDVAARRRPELAPVEGLLEAMDAPDLTPAAFLALDVDLHVALAETAGNAVVVAVMGALRSSIQGYVTEAVAELDDWPAMAQRLRAEHRGIVAAISAQDPAGAARRVRRHIEGFHRATSCG